MLLPLATATANTPELRDSLISSNRRKGGGAVGCAGGIRRSWCAAAFVLRCRPKAACSRTSTSARSGCCCSIRPSSSQRPHAQAHVAWRSGWSGARPRRHGAVVWMGGVGDRNAASSSLQPEQQVVGENHYARPEVPKWRHKAVIIPGFATDARVFEKLCHRLERRGVASVVVPIRWYHWLPTLGGRSVRPILDRIHETVIRCVCAQEHKDMPYAFNEPGLQSEVAPYTAEDFWAEMGDPKRGAHHMGPIDLPDLPSKPSVDERVVLIAHSAGGWMSRIYLSEACYDGRIYNASHAVNGLVTLGTPHVRLTDDKGRHRELPFSRNFKFVEKRCTGEKGGDWEKRIPTVCIGGSALEGRSTFGGMFKDLVYQSYELCCGDGSGTGDGITPLKSAFDMAGAKRYVELEGVLHAARMGGKWYGSDDVIDSWLEPSLDTIFGPPVEGMGGTQDVFKTATEPPQKGASRTVVHDGDRVQNDVT
ncbi:unnamed protein product [Ectocarpus sp. 8 AP-2014]